MNFWKRKDGTAGLEFALIAPLMLMIWGGVVELTNYMTVARRAEMSANAMAQVLAVAGSGSASAMHHVWQIPVQINPTQYLEYPWDGGTEWRMPFAFSQIVPRLTDSNCVIDCETEPSRDFMFAFGGKGMVKDCAIDVVSSNTTLLKSTQLPEQYVNIDIPVMMVGHVVQYKPYFSGVFDSVQTSDSIFEIKNIAYSSRYDGKIWNYPPNGHPMYTYCNGPN